MNIYPAMKFKFGNWEAFQIVMRVGELNSNIDFAKDLRIFELVLKIMWNQFIRCYQIVLWTDFTEKIVSEDSEFFAFFTYRNWLHEKTAGLDECCTVVYFLMAGRE